MEIGSNFDSPRRKFGMKHEIKRKRDASIHLVDEHAGCWMHTRANTYRAQQQNH